MLQKYSQHSSEEANKIHISESQIHLNSIAKENTYIKHPEALFISYILWHEPAALNSQYMSIFLFVESYPGQNI